MSLSPFVLFLQRLPGLRLAFRQLIGADGLRRADLGRLGVEMPDTITPASDAELAEFLTGREITNRGQLTDAD